MSIFDRKISRRRFVQAAAVTGVTLLLPTTLEENIAEARRIFALDRTMLLRQDPNPGMPGIPGGFVHFAIDDGRHPVYRYTVRAHGREHHPGVVLT